MAASGPFPFSTCDASSVAPSSSSSYVVPQPTTPLATILVVFHVCAFARLLHDPQALPQALPWGSVSPPGNSMVAYLIFKESANPVLRGSTTERNATKCASKPLPPLARACSNPTTNLDQLQRNGKATSISKPLRAPNGPKVSPVGWFDIYHSSAVQSPQQQAFTMLCHLSSAWFASKANNFLWPTQSIFDAYRRKPPDARGFTALPGQPKNSGQPTGLARSVLARYTCPVQLITPPPLACLAFPKPDLQGVTLVGSLARRAVPSTPHPAALNCPALLCAVSLLLGQVTPALIPPISTSRPLAPRYHRL